MAGWETLGQVLGGGINREAAFMEGQLHSAKTQKAIAEAKMKRDQQAAIAELAQLAPEMLVGETAPLGKIMAAGLGTDYAGVTQGRLRNQEFDLRARAADPATDFATMQRSLGAIHGQPFSPVQAVGSGGYVNIMDERPQVANTPLGEAMVQSEVAQANANNALAEYRRSPRGAKVPSGYELDPEDTSRLRPIPGGPADPTAKPPKAPAITTESQAAAGYYDRMRNNEAVLSAIDEAGYQPNYVDFAAAVPVLTGGAITSSLANMAMSDQGKQYYQAVSDWVRAKLRKESGAVIGKDEMLAEIRTYFPLPNDPPETRAQKKQARQVAQSAMERSGAPSLAAVPGEDPNILSEALPPRNAKGWQLHTDANGNRAYVSPDGSQYEEVQ